MRTRADKQSRRGQTAVEMALLLPIFMMLLVGIMDFGRLYWTKSVVRGAAYEGVRVAILSEASNEQVESTIRDELAIGGLSQVPALTVGTREPNSPVDVTVSVPFNFIAIDNFIPMLANLTEVSTTAVMTHER